MATTTTTAPTAPTATAPRAYKGAELGRSAFQASRSAFAGLSPVFDSLADTNHALVACFPFPARREAFHNVDCMLASTRFWHPLLNGYSSFIPERYDHEAAALDGDELEVLDQPGQPFCRGGIGQDPVLGAVYHQGRDVVLRQVVAEIGEPGIDAGVAGDR